MVTLIISFLMFLTTLILHLLFRRIGGAKQKLSMRIYADFGLGFLTDAGIIAVMHILKISGQDLPVSSLLLYVLMALSYIIFAASPVMGEESPSSVIVLMAQKNGSVSYKDILRELSGSNPIRKRLDDLVTSGWVGYQNGRYQILPFGKKLLFPVKIYRSLLKMQTG
jgi:hypothetical protein